MQAKADFYSFSSFPERRESVTGSSLEPDMGHDDYMKVCIHRGSNEIGGSCIEIKATGKRILLDAGLPLSEQQEGASTSPEVGAEDLLAIIISHPHLDHYGLLPQMPKAPVIMGQAARQILQAAAPFVRNPMADLTGPDLVDRRTISIGPFRITPFLVDHSAYDAYALLIEAEGKRLFYTGDFRAHGRKHATVEHLIANPPQNIDVLLLEGTTLGRTAEAKPPQSEAELEAEFEQRFRETRGLIMVNVSAQNIDRMVTLYRACKKTGRTLAIDLYAAEILRATGNPSIPQSTSNHVALCIPHRQRVQIKNSGMFELLAYHSKQRIYLKRDISKHPDRYVLLFRTVWMRELVQAECLNGSHLIHSLWEGYLSDAKFDDVRSWVEANGIGFSQIHTSGHASPNDLCRMATALSPRTAVPIHTDTPDGYHRIYDRITRHADGEWWNV